MHSNATYLPVSVSTSIYIYLSICPTTRWCPPGPSRAWPLRCWPFRGPQPCRHLQNRWVGGWGLQDFAGHCNFLGYLDDTWYMGGFQLVKGGTLMSLDGKSENPSKIWMKKLGVAYFTTGNHHRLRFLGEAPKLPTFRALGGVPPSCGAWCSGAETGAPMTLEDHEESHKSGGIAVGCCWPIFTMLKTAGNKKWDVSDDNTSSEMIFPQEMGWFMMIPAYVQTWGLLVDNK